MADCLCKHADARIIFWPRDRCQDVETLVSTHYLALNLLPLKHHILFSYGYMIYIYIHLLYGLW